MAMYVKAFALVVKTASKPLAKRLRVMIEESARARRIAIDAARWASRVSAFVSRDDVAIGESGTRRARAAEKKTLARAAMSEEQALRAASEFVGEAFVFAVAGGVVWWEVDKSNAKDEKRRADAAAERAQLSLIIDAQHETMADMAALIEDLMAYKKASTAAVAASQREAAAR